MAKKGTPARQREKCLKGGRDRSTGRSKPKLAWHTHRSAQAFYDRLPPDQQAGRHVYQCGYCYNFHIGRPPTTE